MQSDGSASLLRVNPAPPFHTVGVDLAGPFLCHRGNPRKPTRIKTYSCVFVCFATGAVHLELLSDMSTHAFLAGFSRFCSRRGSPSVVFSDNGSNFVVADYEMKKAFQQMLSSSSIYYIMQYASAHSIDWCFSQSCTPHFGGLWEAGVRAMKGIYERRWGLIHYLLKN